MRNGLARKRESLLKEAEVLAGARFLAQLQPVVRVLLSLAFSR
jgi:hypothetical protein